MSLSIQEIERSIKRAGSIKDPIICNGEPIKTGLRRRLEKYSGGCAVVFPFIVNGEKWSFRCWYADLGNVERRLRTLSEGLGKLSLPYFAPFFYEAEGIDVEGRLYPTTRMKWVDGLNLNEYICKNKNKPDTLLKLAKEFEKMCKILHKHKIAHGDLASDNILINEDGSISLIDYDSVFIPQLEGFSDIVKGHTNYKHPARDKNVYSNEKLDYFAELIIYLSIISIAENPDLANKYNLKDADQVLFSDKDFEDLENSQIYSDLQKLSDKVQKLLSILQDYISKDDISDLEPFEVLFARMQASLTLSKEKIKKGKESARLSWNVISADKVVLLANGQFLQDCSNAGAIKVQPDVDTEYCLQIFDGNPNKPEVRKAKLLVRPEATVEFFSDKEYTLPTVPLKLSWNVKDAIAVEYDNKQKQLKDSVTLIDGIEKDTTFTIKVTDEFGTHEHSVKVRMLPMPIIETLLVPTPEIEDTINVTANMPIQFSDSQLVELNTPKIDYKDIEKLAEQMPNINKMPIMQTPDFELPKSIPEKIDKTMSDFTTHIQFAVEDALLNCIQKCKNIVNR